MALVPLANYVSEISPHLAGCPTAVMVQYLRKVFTDMCERTLCWRTDLDAITLSSAASSYPLVSPVAGTDVYLLTQARLRDVDADTVSTLSLTTPEIAYSRYPDFPNDAATGTPQIAFCESPLQVSVAPLPPDTPTYELELKAALRPSSTATTVDQEIFEQFKRAVFHGALHELMTLPKRAWSNKDLAGFHGKQWEYFLYSARARANKGFGRSNLTAVMRPWA